ncbi:contractile injection system protein, VgrG/Pvc8 family [Desulfoluna spongiiphila]|uniref:contractile injection system protein, VgrG/Pvc8 family n=1 Tax=Desulfoluna spongiiphila TaxID=419481 RepID=UPI00125BFC5F|nr:contractile injection system protein, VgrG/Pvc8 family [Desulfoluna spongiiphila]VVS90697.1 phage late control gene d protein (gpd) [Desulfoluna spongiiphila]
MTPDYRIEANGNDITDTVKDRLISLTVLDEAGLKSDTLVLELDNRGNRVALPAVGARIEVWLGYAESGLASMGTFTADELRVEGPAETLTIVADAADMTESLKEVKERSWHGVTLGDLVSTLAMEHGFTPQIHSSLEKIALGHLDQAESDLHLLTRLGTRYGAMAKTATGRLLFLPRGKAATASGTAIPPVRLKAQDLTRWSMRQVARKAYSSTLAFWQDMDRGAKGHALVGAGHPQRVLTVPSPTPEAAYTKALAAHRTAPQQETTLAIECAGRFDLMTGTPLDLREIGPGIDGPWVLDHVTHTLDSTGYNLRARARPKAS